MMKQHPKGLWFLFFTEFWERFSFYGISAILVLYLTAENGMHISGESAGLIAGSYITYLYLTTALGGILADRLIGYQWAVFLGGGIIMLGHISLSLSYYYPPLFYLGLGSIAGGTGLFKANVSVMVGLLYDKKENSYLRATGFSIFYAGINIGALIAMFIVGYVGEVIGWHYAFSLAAFGMLSGLLVLKYGLRYLPKSTHIINPKARQSVPVLRITYGSLVGIGALLMAGVFALLIPHPLYSSYVIGLSSIILLIYLINMLKKAGKTAKRHIALILFMSLFMLLFWSLNNQISLSLPLFINAHVNLEFLGLNWTTTAVLGCYLLLLTLINPLFAYVLQKMSRKGQGAYADEVKFALALIFEASAFILLGIVAYSLAANGLIGIYWILLFQFLLVLGELFISPIGLSLVTRLAPKNMAATMMGIWWTISAYAGFLGGIIGSMTATRNAVSSIPAFSKTYILLGVAAFTAAVILFVILFYLRLKHKES
ncbi:MAG: peptide MFS transporter [Francisellaceae bacterium]